MSYVNCLSPPGLTNGGVLYDIFMTLSTSLIINAHGYKTGTHYDRSRDQVLLGRETSKEDLKREEETVEEREKKEGRE